VFDRLRGNQNLNLVMKKSIILFSLFTTIASVAYAQQDPTELASREKQMVLDSIPSLTDDQKQLLEFVYTQYGESLKSVREEMQANGGDREAMRGKMQAIRKEKNDGLKDIFNEEQMTTYKAMMEKVRENMQQRRGKKKNKQG